MYKWSDIERQVLGKLFLTQEEAKNQGYWKQFRDLANEGLFIIANGVKPRIRELNVITYDEYLEEYLNDNYIPLKWLEDREWNIIPKVGVTIDDDSIKLDGKLDPGEEITLNTNQYSITNVYEIKIVGVENGRVLIILNPKKNRNIVDMPFDFLSFADLVDTFIDWDLKEEKVTFVKYITDKKIGLKGYGTFKIYYNSLYDLINEDDLVKDNILKDVDYTILQLLVSYIAYNLLMQDDVQRSMILKNEFELMLSRLDDGIMYESMSYESIGGWY